jgi:hypothetical protein
VITPTTVKVVLAALAAGVLGQSGQWGLCIQCSLTSLYFMAEGIADAIRDNKERE